MIDLARYRGTLLAALAIAASCAGLDLAATVLIGDVRRALPHGEGPNDWWVVERGGRLIAGAGADLRRSVGGPRLGVLLGQSTLLAGVDAEALEGAAGGGRRWLNLAGVGGSVHRTVSMARLLFDSRLRPEVAVIGINPYMLVGTPATVLRRIERVHSRNAIKPYVWSWENRPTLNQMNRIVLHEARRALFRRFGMGTEEMFAPDPRPWAAAEGHNARRITPEEMKGRLEFNEGLGWYSAANYDAPADSNAKALEGLIRTCRDRGAEVVLVLMPERSTQRRLVPAEAKRRLLGINAGPFGDRPVPILDFQDRIPDDLFYDLDHLAPEGRARTTRLLGEALRDRFGSDKPGLGPISRGAIRPSGGDAAGGSGRRRTSGGSGGATPGA